MRLKATLNKTLTHFPWIIFERETGLKLQWNDAAIDTFPALFDWQKLEQVVSRDVAIWVDDMWSTEDGFYTVKHTHDGRYDRTVCEISSDFVSCIFVDAGHGEATHDYPFADWSKTPICRLSQTQREIIAHIADGLSTKEIAHSLELSVRRTQELTKIAGQTIGVHGIGPLVKVAVQYGLNSKSVHYKPIYQTATNLNMKNQKTETS